MEQYQWHLVQILSKGISTSTQKRQPIVFECLINMVPQNTTTDGNQTHSTIQKFEIWNVLIDVFIENTTELMIKSNTTYTNQLIINQRQSTLAKHQPYKTQPIITSIIKKKKKQQQLTTTIDTRKKIKGSFNDWTSKGDVDM